MYKNTAENSVIQLYLWYYLHNIIFKIKHKLYRPTGSQSCPPPPPLPPQVKKIWVCIWTWLYCTLIISFYDIISNSNFIMSNCTICEWRIGMDAERCDCGLRYSPGICVDGLRKNMETISQDNQWPGQDSNRVSPNTNPDVPALSAYSVMH